MKLLYLITLLSLLFTVYGETDDEHDDFTVFFYGKPHYKNQVGQIWASVSKGQHPGTPRGNITVASFTAPDWLEVTLYNGYYWSGKSKTFRGPQKKIKPFLVHSVKWRHL